MQIHEFETFTGTPSESDYLALDDGTETFKIPMTDVGITTEMTTEELETGTETAPRVISPAVLKSFVDAELTPISERPYVVEEGTSGGWFYRKWNNGRLDAERIWNVGQVTLGTAEGTTHRASNDLTVPTFSMAISGSVEAVYLGTSSNSPTFMERVTPAKVRVAKVITSNVTLQNVTFALRLVGGMWK